MNEDDRVEHEPGRLLPRLIVGGIAVALAGVWLIPGAVVDENRDPRAFPAPSVAGVLSAGDFRAVDAALLDRLPAKGGVVAVVGSTLLGAGLSTSPDVFLGASGEPFLSGDFGNACAYRAAIENVDAETRAVRDALAAQGVAFLYAVAPDKSSIERDRLGPLRDRLLACSDLNRSRLQAAADTPGSPLLVGWDEFEQQSGRLYLFGDSHWNPRAAALFAGMVIDRLGTDGIVDDRLFDRADVVAQAPIEHHGDLFALLGIDRIEPLTPLVSERPGVTTTLDGEEHDGVSTQRWVSTSTDAALIPGRTLILHDSFLGYNSDVLAPYFADLTSLPLSAVGTPGALATLDGYDLVIVQQVQRSAPSSIDSIPAADWISAGRTHDEVAPVP